MVEALNSRCNPASHFCGAITTTSCLGEGGGGNPACSKASSHAACFSPTLPFSFPCITEFFKGYTVFLPKSTYCVCFSLQFHHKSGWEYWQLSLSVFCTMVEVPLVSAELCPIRYHYCKICSKPSHFTEIQRRFYIMVF